MEPNSSRRSEVIKMIMWRTTWWQEREAPPKVQSWGKGSWKRHIGKTEKRKTTRNNEKESVKLTVEVRRGAKETKRTKVYKKALEEA